MNRKKPSLSPLIAARVNTTRRGPWSPRAAKTGPPLRLSDSNEARAGTNRPEMSPSVPAQIHALLCRLQRVVRTAEISECRNVVELRLLQECIDGTVAAISALRVQAGQEDRKHFVLGGLPDLLALRTGGRSAVARTTLSAVYKLVDRVVQKLETALGLNQPVSVDDLLSGKAGRQVADENALARNRAVNDAEFSLQISELTQIDVLAHTRSQFSRRSKTKADSILDIDPDA